MPEGTKAATTNATSPSHLVHRPRSRPGAERPKPPPRLGQEAKAVKKPRASRTGARREKDGERARKAKPVVLAMISDSPGFRSS